MSPPSGTGVPPKSTIIVAARRPISSAGEPLATVFRMKPVIPGGRFKRSAISSGRIWPSTPLQNWRLYVANTAGWMTAEIGRQPWVVYGLLRTSEGYSKTVSAGNTLYGFALPE